MEKRDELEVLDARLTELWQHLCAAREAGDWRAYWSLRRVWLAVGRLHSLLHQQIQEEDEQQTALFDVRAFRPHDPAA